MLSHFSHVWLFVILWVALEKAMAPHSSTLAWRIPWMEEPGRLQSMGLLIVGHDWATSLSLFTFHFHALEKEVATHSSVLAWRIPGTEEPVGLPSMGAHRVGHNWCDLAAAAAAWVARQAPLSMGFPKEEYWSGFPFPPPEDLPNSGIEPESHCFMTYVCIFRGFQTFLWFLVKWKLLSCVWLCDSMVYTVHGILPVRILKW